MNTLFAKGDQANGYNWGLSGQVLESNVTKWASMKGLHLFDNSFSGTISDEMGNLKDLGEFGLIFEAFPCDDW